MKADVQGVGESVLLDLEGYQFLMARDDARLLGSALLRVVATGGDVLNDPLRDPSQPFTLVDVVPEERAPEVSAQSTAASAVETANANGGETPVEVIDSPTA